MPEFNTYRIPCMKWLLTAVHVMERTAAHDSNETVAPNELADKGTCTYHTQLPQNSKKW